MQFWTRALCGTFLRNYFEFGPVVLSEEERLFNNISYLVLWWPRCSVEQNHLCKFGRGHPQEYFL